MSYSRCKMVSLGQKLKMPKRWEKLFYGHITVFVCKNPLQKTPIIFEKWQRFENGQNWPQCMGYSPCKMVSLVHKLKMPKRCEKRFLDLITVVVCKKKTLQKTPNIRKIEPFGLRLGNFNASVIWLDESLRRTLDYQGGFYSCLVPLFPRLLLYI